MVKLLYTDPHGLGAPTEITVADDVAATLLVNESFRRADAPEPAAGSEPIYVAGATGQFSEPVPVPSPEVIATET
jgi:hypothetical protein